MKAADSQRIHELEYELGFRDDPPPIPVTDERGRVISYFPNTPRGRRQAFMVETLVREGTG